MTHIKFEIPPRPKGRPRFAKGHAYTPKLTNEYEKTIAEEYVLKGLKKHLGAISVFITFNYRIPMSRIKELKHGDICVEKASVDTLSKGIIDSLNGIAFLDKKMIYKISVEKKWNERNSIELLIFEFNNK